MSSQLVDRVIQGIEAVSSSYHRLVVLVALSGTGKTSVLLEVGQRVGVPVVNLNLALSKSMLELTERQRILQLPQILNAAIGENPDRLCLLDNVEMLFDTALQHDPLKLILAQSRNKTVVVAWNGTISDDHLVYAEPGHPEHRRYPVKDFLVVSDEA